MNHKLISSTVFDEGESRVASLSRFAKQLRIDVLTMTSRAGAAHVGSNLGLAEIIACLYGEILRVDPNAPDDPLRDRFVLSKGHAGAIVYSALARRGFFSPDLLNEYCVDGSQLMGHLSKNGLPGVEFSTGSLGHGVSYACGLAFAAKLRGMDFRVYCVVSDGECNEGSVWESAMFAAHHNLDNLWVIVDKNGLQSLDTTVNTLNMDPLDEKWRAFGWDVRVADGHDLFELARLFSDQGMIGQPKILIAKTVKGRGVSFMENQVLWHYRPPSQEELRLALQELES